MKDNVLIQLRLDRDVGKQVNVHSRFYLELPLVKAHSHNMNSPAVLMSNEINSEVANKIYSLVAEGIPEVRIVKMLLQKFVKEDLFRGKQKPSEIDRSFYPFDSDIVNHIRLSIARQKTSNVDQEELAARIVQWKCEDPTAKFHFRPYSYDKETNMKENLLFVHQENWQHVLMKKNGDLFLMDATYKTMKYDLPLFFLCVKTNMDYVVVAQFVVQSENAATINEALNIIKSWNPSWKPRFAMVDYSEAEINSIEEMFPDVNIYLCDFHREQSWVRWMRKSDNGFTSEEEKNAKAVLRRIASSMTSNDLLKNLEALGTSLEFNRNEKYKKWLEKQWLPHHILKKWVRLYLHQDVDVIINTNNGIERQNKTLKHNYLALHKDKSLSGVVTIIKNHYFPEMLKKYAYHNAQLSREFKAYNDDVDLFLHERPPKMVEHVMRRKVSALDYTKEEVVLQCSEVGIFLVKSENNNQWYTVNFSKPSCECSDWKNTLWPCKHLLAVFMQYPEWNWDKLPATYKNSPYNTADTSFTICLSSSKVTFNENVIVNENIDQSDPQPSTSSIVELPGRRKTNLTKEKSKLVARLKETMGLVYNCSDATDITECNSILDEINALLTGNVVSQDGLPLRCDLKSVPKHSSQSDSNKYSNLSSGRKPKFQYKYRKRFGVKADFMQSNYNCKLTISNTVLKAKSLKKNALRTLVKPKKSKETPVDFSVTSIPPRMYSKDIL